MSSQTSSSWIGTPSQIGSNLPTACWSKAIGGVRAAAFWATIFLPFAYVPAADGALGFESAWSALALIVIHMACVVIGHEHNTDSATSSTSR